MDVTPSAGGPRRAAALLSGDSVEDNLRRALDAPDGRAAVTEALLDLEKDDPAAARRLVQALGRVEVPAAAEALMAYRERAAVKAVRKAAGASLARLAAVGVSIPRADAQAPTREREPHPARHGLITFYDRLLSRRVLLPVRGGSGRGAVMMVIHDRRGIMAAEAMPPLSRADMAALQDVHGPRIQQMIPIPLDYAHFLFHEARFRGHGQDGEEAPLPPELAPWAPHIPKSERPYPHGLLPEALPELWKEARRAAAAGERPPVTLKRLLREPETGVLFFVPGLVPAARQAIVRLQAAGGLVLSGRARREHLERAVAQVAEEVYGGPTRGWFLRIMLETAYWWWHFELEDHARTLATVAAPLADPAQSAGDCPLVRVAVVLTLMEEAQNTGDGALFNALSALLPPDEEAARWQATGSRLLIPRSGTGQEPAAEAGSSAKEGTEGASAPSETGAGPSRAGEPGGAPAEAGGTWRRKGGLYIPRS